MMITKKYLLPLALYLLTGLMISCTSDNGDALATKGLKDLKEARFEDAINKFEEAISKGLNKQKLDLIYTCMGNAYCELNEFENAISAHEKALDINPKNHQAWVNLGIVYRLTSQFDKAEDCYAKALNIKPDYAELHASLGALYVFQNKYELAVEHLEKATKLDGNLAVAWANLSLAYATLGQFEKAEDHLKKAVVLGYPNGPSIKKRIENLKATSDEKIKNSENSTLDAQP